MEDDQQFCLRWNNHQSTIIQNFDTLLESGTLVDCTLAAEGKYLKAHKVVLSACSPYFEGLLSEHYDKHPVFILKDVKFKELKAMMDYMYRGEVNISQDQLTALLKAAESLQIKGLSDSRTDKGTGNAGNTTTGGSKDNTRPAKTASSTAAASASAAAVDIPHTSSGLTIEKNSKVPRQSIQQVSVSDQLENSASPQLRGHSSREGSQSPTRKRKRLRRRSLGNDDNSMENHEASNSSDVNMTAPALGVAPVAEEKSQADPADSIGRSALMQQLTKPADEMLQMPLEKPEPSEDMIQPKSEYQDDQESVEDLTNFDDDMNDLNEMEQDNSRAGPSHDPSQHAGMPSWHIAGDRSNASVVGAAAGPGAGDEVFLAAAEAAQAQRDSQDTVANKSAADAEKTKTPVKKAKPGPLSRKDKSKASPKETETGPSINADKNKKPTEETPELATSTNADKSDKLTEETAPGTSTDAAKSETSTKGPEPAACNLGSTGECIFIKTEIEYSSGDDDNDATTEDDNGTKAGTSDPLATNWAMVYCATCKVLSEYVRTKTKRNCTNCQNPLFYQCTRCKKCLSTLQCLQTHIKVHEREEHHCEHCDFRTANKNVLQQHLETRHVTRGPFGREECPKCKRTYKSRKLMLMHSKRCGVTPEFKCGFCPYMAKTIMILRDHVKKRHISKEESVCECGKKFTNKKYFEKHQQNCDKAVPKRRF